MRIARRTFALLLAMTPGVGGKGVVRVLARNDLLGRTPEEFLALSEEALREEYRLQAKPAAMLARTQARKAAVEVFALEERLDRLGVSLVTAADAHYPVRVEAMDPQPPGVLFLYGNAKLLGSRTFAVLASRGTPPRTLDLLEERVEAGVLDAEVLVSGHDRPEYQRAAVVPLRWGSPRILCLDRGVFEALGDDLREEPFRAARLWRYQFDPSTDLVVSPFRPEAHYVGVNNQVRDRLVACLSDRIELVHATSGGNMERNARLALKAGRPVKVAQGCACAPSLLALGAELLQPSPLEAEGALRRT